MSFLANEFLKNQNLIWVFDEAGILILDLAGRYKRAASLGLCQMLLLWRQGC